MVDRIGQQLGNYRLTRFLGKGGFAEVYLGEHVYLKTLGAIKLLQTKVGNEEDLESFLKEAQTIAQLVHPHIVRVLEFGLDGETPYLVMDYAVNGTLRQRHPKGTQLPPTTIVPYVKQVAEALQYAHEEKFIHRDIKPENILVGKRDTILLSDFGIALIAQSSRYQSTQDVIGTVAYMSPEQIQGKPRPASDQYSLAIVVYEWLGGTHPFRGSFTELCTQHMFASPPPLLEKVPNLSPDVEQVVFTALAKDPKHRFATVLAFANAFEQASQTAPGGLVLPTSGYQHHQYHPPTISASSSGSINQMPPPAQPITPQNYASIPPTQYATPNQPQRQYVVAEPPGPVAPPKKARVNLAPLGFSGMAAILLLIDVFSLIVALPKFYYLLQPIYVDYVFIEFIPLGIIICGSIAQIIAGWQMSRVGNRFLAITFHAYGGFFLITLFLGLYGEYLLYTYLLPYFSGYFSFLVVIIAWTIFSGIMFISALKRNRTLGTLFGSLFLFFLFFLFGSLLLIFIHIYYFASAIYAITGILGIVTAIIALYAAVHPPISKPLR